MDAGVPTRSAAAGGGPWATHRVALALAVRESSASIAGTGDRPGFPLDGPDAEGFLAFLIWHGLAGWWLQACERDGSMTRVAPELAGNLRDLDRAARVHHMAQSHAVRQLTAAMDERHLSFACLKGVAIRDEIYTQPHARSATDIDVLVHPKDRRRAGDILHSLGFVHTGDRSSAHEETWQRGSVDIDLHWDVLAPGRTRKPLVEELLARRVRQGAVWRLSDEDTVALMLLHPAVTKYVCSPHVGLNRVVDFLVFVQARPVAWDKVADLIRDSGLSGAAWCMLSWIDMLDDPETTQPWPFIPAGFRRRLEPGPLRRAYFRPWLVRDWPGRLVGRADWLVRLAFTLPFHDHWSDAWRAIRYRAERISSAKADA